MGAPSRSCVRWTLPLLCLVLLVSCTHDRVRPVSSWIGKHRDALLKEFGPPRSDTTLREGGRRLEYVPIQHSPENSRYAYGGMEVCRMIFMVDEAGIVTAWTFYGCRPNK